MLQAFQCLDNFVEFQALTLVALCTEQCEVAVHHSKGFTEKCYPDVQNSLLSVVTDLEVKYFREEHVQVFIHFESLLKLPIEIRFPDDRLPF